MSWGRNKKKEEESFEVTWQRRKLLRFIPIDLVVCVCARLLLPGVWERHDVLPSTIFYDMRRLASTLVRAPGSMDGCRISHGSRPTFRLNFSRYRSWNNNKKINRVECIILTIMCILVPRVDLFIPFFFFSLVGKK
jgi:hypothetical protein